MPGATAARGCAVALLRLAILAVIDIAATGTFARSLYLLPVLAIAIRAPGARRRDRGRRGDGARDR